MKVISKATLSKTTIVLAFFMTIESCSTSVYEEKAAKSEYPRMIGDIAFDPALDDSSFQVCYGDNRLIQYYSLGEKTYTGGKIAIEKFFEENYDTTKTHDQSGLVRIRFIVNCKGESGRFRILGMDPTYKELDFDASITDQLLALTKSLDSWKVFKNQAGREKEYYQYLIFKIQNGRIVEIMP